MQLKRLQSKRIPILFRFLHEADGGWFWWGAQGPEAAVKLYRLGYDRLTNYHKINNIIWVWNSVCVPPTFSVDRSLSILILNDRLLRLGTRETMLLTSSRTIRTQLLAIMDPSAAYLTAW